MGKKYPVKNLASVCLKITDGSHFSPDMAEAGYPYITVRDINDDKIDFSNCKFVSKDDYEALKKNGCAPKYGDLLFSKDGTVGKVAIVDTNEQFVVLSSLAIITPDETQISSEFLFYVLKSPAFLQEAIGRKTGAAIRRIILKHLKSIEFPLPPLPVQKAIVAKLDAAFASIEQAIAAAEQNAENAKQLFQSYLSDVFERGGDGWEEKSLPTIAKVSTGKWDANHAKKDGAYRFYTCASKYVYSDTKRFFGSCLILPGNGANVGDVYFYDGEFDAYQRTYVISDITINPHFLYHHMSCFWSIRNKDKQFGSATNFIKIGNFHD